MIFFKSKCVVDVVYLVMMILIVTMIKDMVVSMYKKRKDKQWLNKAFGKTNGGKNVEGFYSTGAGWTTASACSIIDTSSSVCDRLKFLLCDVNIDKLRRLLNGITTSTLSLDGFHIHTHGGSIWTDGGVIETAGGFITTTGGYINLGNAALTTGGGLINTGGGLIQTDGGNILTSDPTNLSGGGFIDTGGGDIKTWSGDIDTTKSITTTSGSPTNQYGRYTGHVSFAL